MSKQEKHPVVFAMFPNQRGFGYCVMDGPQTIIDSGIVTIRPFCNTKTIERFDKLLQYFQPTVVIVDNPQCKYARRSPRVADLIRHISDHAKKQKLSVAMYSREQVRYVFNQFQAQTKFEIAKQITEWFPELKSKTPKQRRLWENESYWQGAFDALSLAICHYYLEE